MNSSKFFISLLLILVIGKSEIIEMNNKPVVPPRYIRTIDFIVSDSKIETDHEHIILQDINEGAGGKYIYAVKAWTFDPEEAVTDFHFVQDALCPSGFIRLEQDLNEGAGGKYNYLCIRRGGAGEKKVLDIDIRSYDYKLTSGQGMIDEWTLFPYDLNDKSNIRGDYIYLLYKK